MKGCVMRFKKTTYIVKFEKNDKPDVVLHGIEELAGFASDDLYKVTGLNDRELSEAEVDEWERLSDLVWGDTVLPVGLKQ